MTKNKNTSARTFYIRDNVSGAKLQADGTFYYSNVFDDQNDSVLYFSHIDDACAKLLLIRLRDGPTNYNIMEVIDDEWMPKRIKSPRGTQPRPYLNKIMKVLIEL